MSSVQETIVPKETVDTAQATNTAQTTNANSHGVASIGDATINVDNVDNGHHIGPQTETPSGLAPQPQQSKLSWCSPTLINRVRSLGKGKRRLLFHLPAALGWLTLGSAAAINSAAIGAFLGQIAIPIPGVGAVVGGLITLGVAQLCYTGAAWLAADKAGRRRGSSDDAARRNEMMNKSNIDLMKDVAEKLGTALNLDDLEDATADQQTPISPQVSDNDVKMGNTINSRMAAVAVLKLKSRDSEQNQPDTPSSSRDKPNPGDNDTEHLQIDHHHEQADSVAEVLKNTQNVLTKAGVLEEQSSRHRHSNASTTSVTSNKDTSKKDSTPTESTSQTNANSTNNTPPGE